MSNVYLEFSVLIDIQVLSENNYKIKGLSQKYFFQKVEMFPYVSNTEI